MGRLNKLIDNVEDMDIEQEFKKLEQLEIALDNSESNLFRHVLVDNDIDVEGLVDTMKQLWIRLKSILAHLGNIAKRLWLRALVFFAKNDDMLSEYKKKLKNKLVLNPKNKGEIRDLLKKHVLSFSYGFRQNDIVETDKLFSGKTNSFCKDLVKEINNPDMKLVDFLTGKADIEFVSFNKDVMTFIVRSSQDSSDKDKYIKIVREPMATEGYNRLEELMLDKVDNNATLVEMRQLFDSALSYDEIKKLISVGFKSLKGYDDEARKLASDDDSSLVKTRHGYDTLKAFSRFTYGSTRQAITNTKLAISIGELIFDKD